MQVQKALSEIGKVQKIGMKVRHGDSHLSRFGEFARANGGSPHHQCFALNFEQSFAPNFLLESSALGPADFEPMAGPAECGTNPGFINFINVVYVINWRVGAMSAESQETSRVEKPESVFDSTRIKKERNDVCADGGPIVGDGNVTGDGADVISKMEPQRAPATPICTTPRVSNGFHNEDLLREVLVGKFATLAHHTPAAKHEKIRLMIEESIGYAYSITNSELISI